MPIIPRPAATATLMRHDPYLAWEPVHLHRETHRWVHGSNSGVFQSLDHAPGNVIDLIAAVVEFEIRNRARRCPNRLSIHANHEADQCLSGRERPEDVFALVVQSASANL